MDSYEITVKNRPTLRGIPNYSGLSIQVWCFLCNKFHTHGLTEELIQGKRSLVSGHNCALKGYYVKLITREQMGDVRFYLGVVEKCKKEGKPPVFSAHLKRKWQTVG